MYRHLLCAVTLVTLTACAGGDVVRETAPEGYLQDAPARVAAADWSTAKTVEVTLREYAFEPADLSFEIGKPYHLVLRNAGSSDHTFTAPDFFQGIAAQKLVSAEGEEDLPYIEKVAVPSGSSKELYFVPVRAGSYHLECSVFLHESFGMHGEITVR